MTVVILVSSHLLMYMGSVPVECMFSVAEFICNNKRSTRVPANCIKVVSYLTKCSSLKGRM